MNYKDYIGDNIKSVRTAKGLSQQEVADLCGFSNTILSQYERKKKIPNLVTTIKIAEALKVSIDRLVYGDENNAFITAEPNEGRKIVNAVYHLWEKGVIKKYVNYTYIDYPYSRNKKDEEDEKRGVFFEIIRFQVPIDRLINQLNDFKIRKDTYQNPDAFLEMLLDSAATEINKYI